MSREPAARLRWRDRLALAYASLRGDRGRLAERSDAVLRARAGALERQRRFVDNASHELRGALSVIRAEAEVALARPEADRAELRHALAVALETSKRTHALLESLLTLARSQRGQRRRDAPCDLSAVARTAASLAGAQARADGIRLHLALAPAPVRGDSRLLERAAANLVENAVRYNRHNGSVAVESGCADGRAWLRVVNSGPRVAAEEIERIVEPFERLDGRAEGGGGAGLGLAIVRSVAEAHGGRLALAPGPAGGLVAELALPRGDGRTSAAS